MLDWAAYLEHLQVELKEFNPTATPNKETLICYFQESLCPSIWAQLDNQTRDLDVWNKIVEKVFDAEAKAGLQPSFGTKEIDFRYLKWYRSSVKKNKDDTYRGQCNEASNRDKEKIKSYIPLFSANQLQI